MSIIVNKVTQLTPEEIDKVFSVRKNGAHILQVFREPGPHHGDDQIRLFVRLSDGTSDLYKPFNVHPWTDIDGDSYGIAWERQAGTPHCPLIWTRPLEKKVTLKQRIESILNE